MSKESEKTRIREFIEFHTGEPAGQLKIHIQGSPPIYKTIERNKDIDVNVPTAENAESLISFLTELDQAASDNPRIVGIKIFKDE